MEGYPLFLKSREETPFREFTSLEIEILGG
jgi:hypothetical protein